MANFPDYFQFPYFLIGSLTQAGITPPVMTVGVNFLPLGIGVWSYLAQGIYDYTLAGQFVAGKTFPFIGLGAGFGGTVTLSAVRATVNTIRVETLDSTGANTDGILTGAPLIIIIIK